jgi:ADP-heptose:LPS heptosyltransferase
LNIVVLQLLRSGDILQTLLACQYYQRDYPQHQISLVARQSMSKPLLSFLKPFFQNIFFYSEHNQKEIIENIQSWGPHIIVNMSFCSPSASLCELWPNTATTKIGMWKENNQIILHGQWAQYIYASVMSSQINSYSLVDLYDLMLRESLEVAHGHLNHKIPAPIKHNPSMVYPLIQEVLLFSFPSIYREQPRIPQHSYIVVHPFSSHEKKSLPIQEWADFINFILKKIPPVHIILLGSESDHSKFELLENHIEQPKRISIFKDESIIFLIPLIKKSILFLGGDSFCSHILPFTQSPAILFYVGHARPYENIPHMPHIFIISSSLDCFPCHLEDVCHHRACQKSYFEPKILTWIEHVILEISHGPSNHEFSLRMIQNIQKKILNNLDLIPPHLNIYVTEWDELHHIDLIQLNKYQSSLYETTILIQKTIWSFYFFNHEIKINLPKISPSIVSTLDHLFLLAKKSLKVYDFYLYDLKKNLEEIQKHPTSYIQEQRQKISVMLPFLERLDDFEGVLEDIRSKNNILSPLIRFFSIERLQFLCHKTSFSLHEINIFMSNIMQAKLLMQTFEHLVSQLIPLPPHDKNEQPNTPSQRDPS